MKMKVTDQMCMQAWEAYLKAAQKADKIFEATKFLSKPTEAGLRSMQASEDALERFQQMAARHRRAA
jgi:hypothetical protein